MQSRSGPVRTKISMVTYTLQSDLNDNLRGMAYEIFGPTGEQTDLNNRIIRSLETLSAKNTAIVLY
jgi:hypothetical protein